MEIPEESNGEASGVVGGFAEHVNMRGWGAAETIFLLNGRRMPNEYRFTDTESGNSTPNLRAIPLASIERIEILSSAGSAIYGVNATGGVINVITRQDFRGGQAFISYSTPVDANAPKRGVQLSYGFALNSRMNMNLSAGYTDSQPLRAGDRSRVTVERWRRQANVSDANFANLIQPYALLPNVRAVSTTSGDLFPDVPGQQLYAHPISGYVGGDGLTSFIPGPDLQLADGTAGDSRYAKGSLLGPEMRDVTLGFNTRISLNEHWRWHIESRYAETSYKGRPNASLAFINANTTSSRPLVPGDAAINPFEQDVRVYLVDPRLDRPELRNNPRNTTYSVNTTLIGEVGAWRGFVDLGFSHNRNRIRSSSFYEPDGGWYNAFMTGQYNPFVDVSRVAPAAPEFYEHYTVQRAYRDSATRNYVIGAKASGPLFDLPADAIHLTVGLDGSRNDRYRSSYVQQFEDAATGALRTPAGTGVSINTDPRRRFVFDTYAGYAEMTIPVISPRWKIPLSRQLELFASGRLSHEVRRGFRMEFYGGDPLKYTNDTHVHAFGLRYSMLEGLMLRASRSVGFKPPTIDQVTPYTPADYGYGPGVVISITDPVRQESVQLDESTLSVGGDPALKPETTATTNIGVILAPRWAQDFRMSIDYVHNVRDDAVFAFFDPQQMVNAELSVPGRVQRGAPDGDPSGVGPIVFLDMRYLNLNRIASRSVDVSLEQQLHDIGSGRLMLTLAATRNLSFKVQTTPGAPGVEQVRNVSSALSQQMKWNANGQLRWEGRHWGFGWSARYFDYLLVATSIIPLQGSDRAPRKLTHDLSINYRASSQSAAGLYGALAKSSIKLTVQNLFNRPPRFWYPSSDYGVAPGDSIAGRVVTLGIRKDL